ncbi:UPF0175 family protein [Candidatus Woesearchaeota archaeon]|nr:UPF0175 family protein [Candidatus Woesearchaeota archaeon]
MEIASARLDTEMIDAFGKVLNQKRSEVIRNLIETGKKEKAIQLYREKKVSLGLAAELAGTSLSEFIDLLKDHDLCLNLEKEDVIKALETARKVM